MRAASDLQILCSTNLKYRDTVMDFHRASHQCGECRHFHELEVLPADRYAVKRCPHAHEDDGCGRYEHRCMANDCREPIHSYCERDIVDGQLFCHRHSELKRRRAA